MIISTDQILKCLHYADGLDARPSGAIPRQNDEQPAPYSLSTSPPESETGQGRPAGAQRHAKTGVSGPRGLSPEVRIVRIKSLREMLTGDAYDLPPEMLADKMIGRALCDQISDHYEKCGGESGSA